MNNESHWLQISHSIKEAKTDNFMELHKLSGLDKSKDYRFGDWSGIDFSGCSLEGFDFTGARLRDCNFKGAKIKGAEFHQAEINGSNLREAEDWENYKKWWPQFSVKNTEKVFLLMNYKVSLNLGKHLPDFSIFMDSPLAG